MFRLRSAGSCLRRYLHGGGAPHRDQVLRRYLHGGGAVNRDQVLEQLRVCSEEDQVFEVVGRNKAKLTVDHVDCAVGLLWQFQKEKPQMLRTVQSIRSHPEFLTLRVLAENKITLMDESMLVDMLYNVLRLHVEHHDSLVQHLISETWLRIDRLPMSSLSKFAVCLSDQYLQHSPLMGRIVDILSHQLSSIYDARVLTTLMISVSSLVSPRLRDALVDRASLLLDTMDPALYNNARRTVQFLRNIRHHYRPLLEKCNRILVRNVPRLDAENIGIVVGLYQSLQFHNCDMRLAAKRRLTELLDLSAATDPHSFTKLFVALGPMASAEVRQGLENTALLLSDEFTAQQALAVADTLEGIQSRNYQLINRIASVLHRNLEGYRPVDVARVTQTLLNLNYHNPELFNTLRNILLNLLQASVFPHEVTMLTRVLSMLPSPRHDDAVIRRVAAVLPQCSLNDHNTFATTITKWARNDTSHRHDGPSRYAPLLHTLNRCGLERLRTADRLDLVLEELRYIFGGEWFEEMLLEETMATLQRMESQVSWSNLPDLCLFLTRSNYLCVPLMDRITEVALEDMDKTHYSSIYAILLPFGVLNYDNPKVDKLFDVAIEHFTPHISSFNPHMLVFLAYTLAMADCFPEEIIREIFTVDFLAKLDSQLEVVPDALNMRIRLRLMEVNRAVCLECPEFQIPWFHEGFCHQLHNRGSSVISNVQQQVHKMLAEVLGGIHYCRVAVLTPYSYTVDFECVLDQQGRPVAYSGSNALQISDSRGAVSWGFKALEDGSDLRPGAQRVAIDFLDSRSFCKNSTRRMKGEAAMRKRHLEIMGYHVVQIPHFEWNSMELSTQDAWKGYLKKKVFSVPSS